eukprot:TRINITY_DN3089_c0_g1_i1.p1 TRINITY_DN3089_c0_g1~~TRINITY_DN3089_c0_g1_i1.p1  ORF type:complete len:752 (+),score=191.06 TRINITY_DN3089_c0_g1_i1:87-2342(+)
MHPKAYRSAGEFPQLRCAPGWRSARARNMGYPAAATPSAYGAAFAAPPGAAAAGLPRGVASMGAPPASFALPPPSLRVFSRAVACVAKVSRDAAVIFRPEELVLHGADDAHSTAVQFAFRRRFFRATPASQHLGAAGCGLGTPAAPLGSTQASSASGAGAASREETRLVVGARALLSALRGAQQRAVEYLTIAVGAAPAVGDERLVLEFVARFGGKVRHRVPLLDTEAFLPGDPGAGPHVAALTAGLLARVLDHCAPSGRGANAGCEEVTIAAAHDEGLRVRSVDLLSGGGAPAAGGAGPLINRTEVLLQKSDMEICHLDRRCSEEATFSGRALRDFSRAAEACAKDLENMGLLDGSPLMELRFGQGGCVACRVATAALPPAASLGTVLPPGTQLGGANGGPQDFSAVLIVATRELREEVAGGTGATQAPGTQAPAGALPGTQAPEASATASSGRRAQAKPNNKRRAVATLPSAEAFDAFPDSRSGSQRTLASTAPVPTAPARPSPATPMMLASGAMAAGAGATNMAQTTLGLMQRQQPMGTPVGQQRVQAIPASIPSTHPAVPSTLPSSGVAAPPVFGGVIDATQAPQALHAPGAAAAVGACGAAGGGACAAAGGGRQWLWTAGSPAQQAAANGGFVGNGGGALPPTLAATQPASQPMLHHSLATAASSMRAPPQQQQHQQPQMPQHTGCGGPAPVLASALARKALVVTDSDDELIGADPDELAFGAYEGQPLPPKADEDVDWFDLERLW